MQIVKLILINENAHESGSFFYEPVVYMPGLMGTFWTCAYIHRTKPTRRSTVKQEELKPLKEIPKEVWYKYGICSFIERTGVTTI